MQFENSYAQLDPRLYNLQPPNPLKNPRPGHFNPLVAKQLGWDQEPDLMKNWVEILAGSYVPQGFQPLAMAYAGHQFGQWAGQLGDGRGLLMVQVIDKDGELTDLHLKGAGLTPYSRMGDGRAVLRSTIREYLCGHAMNRLGIRSSSSLGFITSDTPVRRETMEQGAALMRVADSHIRLGHVEWIASFAPDLLPSFTKYMIETYYPELATSESPVADFISEVVTSTATMIADWQLVGFAHGVMNTDNLSITGSTIDYGPFGFQERFDPAWINNHSDYAGRYAYQNQPAIGHWNLSIWMMHFMQLSAKHIFNNHKENITREVLADCLAQYEPSFMLHYQQGICNKLGLSWDNLQNETAITDTLKLAFRLLEIIETNKLDYTNSFRALIAVIDEYNNPYEADLKQQLNAELTELNAEQLSAWEAWQQDYLAHINSLSSQPNTLINFAEIVKQLKQFNPVYVLRNSMAQRAIEQAEAGDFSEVDRLFKLLTTPFDTHELAKQQDITPPDRDAKPIVISCSS